MKLWSGLLSPFSAKVRIALAEKGLDVEVLEVPWSRANGWGPKPAEFLAVNPKGQVPVLIDGDVVLPDSTVILEYVEETRPERPLLPAEPVARARARLLETLADELLAGPITALVREVFNPDVPGENEAVRQARREIAQAWDRFEKEIAGREHFCERFGAADIAVFLAVGFASTLGSPPGEQHTGLAAWVARVGARESVAREFGAMTRAAAESRAGL